MPTIGAPLEARDMEKDETWLLPPRRQDVLSDQRRKESTSVGRKMGQGWWENTRGGGDVRYVDSPEREATVSAEKVGGGGAENTHAITHHHWVTE